MLLSTYTQLKGAYIMKKSNTADRLNQIMNKNNLRQVDILEKCKPYCEKYQIRLGRNDLSQYVSGKVEPGQEKLSILAKALNVTESWLMGLDVPMEEEFSVDSLINTRIKELNMSIEEVAKQADVPLNWLKNINTFVPGDMEFTIQEGKGHPLEWEDVIYEFTSYEWITRVAEVIKVPGSKLRAALARQEIPLYSGPTLSADEAFKQAQEDFQEVPTEVRENTIANTTLKAPENIRAAARDMTELSPEDQKTVFDMINFLSQKGKEAKEN